MQMLDDRVMIKRKSAESVTKGGIVLVESAKEMPDEGTVVAFGPGRYLPNGQFIETIVKKGDNVIFSKYVGCEVEWNKQKFTVVRESDILFIL